MLTFTDGTTYGEGAHVVTSLDGYRWRTLSGDPTVLRQGVVGTVVRDPSIVWHDGFFHLVFTTELCAGLTTLSFSCEWQRLGDDPPPARFGYARSRDLVHWTGFRDVAVPLAGACNVWAPEWHVLDAAEAAAAGGNELMVIFSATVPSSGRKADCPPDFGPNAGTNWNRPYYMTTTADAAAFGPPTLLFDPGEPAIDAALFRAQVVRCGSHVSRHTVPRHTCECMLPGGYL